MTNEMTPSELRALADELEGKETHYNDLTVTVDGVTVKVDSRTLDDVKTLRAIQRIAKMDAEKPDGEDVFFVLGFMESLVGEDALEDIEKVLRAKNDGYAPSGQYISFLMRIFSELQALKN